MIKKPFLGYYNLKNKDIVLIDNSSRFVDLEKGKLFCDFNDLGEFKIFLSGCITKPAVKNPVLLVKNLYKKKGALLTECIDGEYLIFIYDKKKEILEIFNNPYETTNFYYYRKEDLIIFADTLKKVIEHIPNLELDKKSIPTFLSNGFSPSEKMQLKNTYRLLPDEWIRIDKAGIELTDSWKNELRFERNPFTNLDKKIDEYEKLFQENISNFLKASKTKSLGIFLSGGSDTSFVYFQASKVYKKPIHTFTATYEGFGFDEAPKAKAVTAMRNGIHHKVLITAKDLDLIPEMVKASEEPLAGSTLAFYILAKEVSKYSDTVFTGDPGDTLWGEYYPVAEWHKYIWRIPYHIRKFLHILSSDLIKIIDWERLWEVEHVLSLFDSKEMYKYFMQRLCTYRHFRDGPLKKLLVFSAEKNDCRIEVVFNRDNFHDTLIEAKMLYGVYFYNIAMSQKFVEANGVNFFAPYLSRDIINFINSLPEEWVNGGSSFQKLSNMGIKRRFHKEALLRYLPKRYVYGVQQSFDVPWHVLFNSRPKIMENLLTRLKRRGWYNDRYLDQIFFEYPRQKVKPYEINELKHHGYRIYCLLLLEVWCMEFLDKVKRGNMPLEEYLEV